MGMDLTIYVGPFLRCERKRGQTDAYDLTDGRLCDLRGALGEAGEEWRYIGPNINMLDIARQLRFRRHDDLPVVADIQHMDERAAFIDQLNVDIATIRKEYGNVTVAWGVVPGYF